MAITKRLVKGSALSHVELDGNFTDYETFKALFDSTTFTAGNDGKLLFWNNSTSNVEVKTATTSEVTEGTNLYFTDARADTRADARITAVVTKPFVDALYSATPLQNSYNIITADFNGVAGQRYMVDTFSNPVTCTLPASPSAGATLEFVQGASGWSGNNLIFDRNGSTINGVASNYNSNESLQIGNHYYMIYDGTTWRFR